MKLLDRLKRKLKKNSPTSSQVHVSAPLGSEEDKIVVKSANGTCVEIFDFSRKRRVHKADGPRRVATVAIKHGSTILMGKRRDNGKWTTPGGHLNPDEDFNQGALREALEETGIDLSNCDLAPVSEIAKLKDQEGKDLHVQPFSATLKSRPPTTMMGDPDGEVERWRWIDISRGLPQEIRANLHVPAERNALMKALDLTEAAHPSDVDVSAYVYPQLDNLEAEVLKAVLEDAEDAEDSNTLDQMYGMQKLVEGMDFELEHTTADPNMAKDVVMSNLETDPDFYTKLRMGEDSTDDQIQKDTEQTEADPDAGEGFNLDLGSGPTRERGHLGLDLYPHDHGTIVHDLNTGIPFPDGTASNVRLCNVDGLEDEKALISEIHRVLMPGGNFVYEGPNDIHNDPDFDEDYPGLVLTNHEDSGIRKDVNDCTVYRQNFTRVAIPDAATANDAEPRFAVADGDQLPGDALMAMDALGYYDSDGTTSGKGNRAHGYASQGALVKAEGGATQSPEKVKRLRFYKSEGQPAEDSGNATAIPAAMFDPIEEEVHRALNPVNPNPPPPKKLARGISKIEKALKFERTIPIMKMNGAKQIVYGVVLAPNEIDAQEDFMEPEEIEKAAHLYLAKSRIVGASHSKPVEAYPVESFIAPQDLSFTGQNGPQIVKKGSWVLGVKVVDPAEWKKIVDGEYTGFSVGGFGLRQET